MSPPKGWFLCLFSLLASIAVVQGVTFTGDAKADFEAAMSDETSVVVTVIDNNDPDTPDVGVPNQVSDGENIISGWDISQIFFQYNAESDELKIGIDCFVICGDADGRDGPDTASPQLVSIGGEDAASLQGTESIALVLDFSPFDANPADFVLGIPGGNPVFGTPPNGENTLCSDTATEPPNYGFPDCFGLFIYDNFPAVAPAFNFRQRALITPAPEMAFPLSETTPDLEMTLYNVASIREFAGSPFENPNEPWSLEVQGFAGSFQDSGVGEDFIPNQNSFIRVDFPCLEFDECDVCLGDGSTCRDCIGIPNGPNVYDECDVCGGDSSTCSDCAGTPNGSAEYDACGVCEGDAEECLDCAGVVNGDSEYDECDVCGGDSSSCADCNGTPNGRAAYDACDVCGGDGTSCIVPPPPPAPRKPCCCPGHKCTEDSHGFVTRKGSCYCGHGVEYGQYYWYGYGRGLESSSSEGFIGMGAMNEGPGHAVDYDVYEESCDAKVQPLYVESSAQSHAQAKAKADNMDLSSSVRTHKSGHFYNDHHYHFHPTSQWEKEKKEHSYEAYGHNHYGAHGYGIPKGLGPNEYENPEGYGQDGYRYVYGNGGHLNNKYGHGHGHGYLSRDH